MLLKLLCLFLAAPILGAAGEPLRLDLGQGVSMDFVKIPAGEVPMGSDEGTGDGDEAPIHLIRFRHSVYAARFETTQAQWVRVMGSNPSHFVGEKLPVDNVSWNQARAFAEKLSALTHHTLRLPSEAEWEYAARAGTATIWSFGSDVKLLSQYAWFTETSHGTTHPVGSLKPNPWGLYDMYGNVGEWCSDWYMKHAYPAGAVNDPPIVPQANDRAPVWRGGAWGDNSDFVRSSSRNCSGPDDHGPGTGVRLWLEDGPP